MIINIYIMLSKDFLLLNVFLNINNSTAVVYIHLEHLNPVLLFFKRYYVETFKTNLKPNAIKNGAIKST